MTRNRNLRTRDTWRRAAAVGLLAISLLGLVACGGGSSGPEDISEKEMAEVLTKSVESLDTAHFDAQISLSMARQKVALNGDGDVQKDPPAHQATMSLKGDPVSGDFESIFVEDTFYLKGLKGDSWMEASDEQLNKLGLSALTAMSNPLSFLDGIEESIKTAQLVGDEKLAGTDTKHYRFTVDPKDVGENLGAGNVEMPSNAKQDIWVDDDGRLHKAVIDLGELGKVEIDLSKHGKPLDIEAPPADLITDMPSAVG